MSNVTAFPSDNMTPMQALLHVQEDIENVESVVVTYFRKDDDNPYLTCSTMQPMEVYFLGGAVQQYSLRFMKE